MAKPDLHWSKDDDGKWMCALEVEPGYFQYFNNPSEAYAWLAMYNSYDSRTAQSVGSPQ